MRIGLDAKRAFYNARGLGNYSRNLIRILSEFCPENDYFLFYSNSSKQKLMECPAHSNIVEPTSLFYKKAPAVWRSYGLSKEFNRKELDIYHGLSNEIPHQVGKSSTRTILTMHDMIFIKFPELYPWLDQKLYKRKYLSSCRRSDSIIAISQQTKQDIVELANIDESKVKVIYQGCSPLFRAPISNEFLQEIRVKYKLPKQYILNVGAIEERKNQIRIIESLAKLKIDIPLVIVGRPVGNWQEELNHRISRLGWSHRVLILNNVPTIDLPAIYRLSELFVYPSFYEGFGIPLIEALSSGVPVISSRGSCLEEAGGPTSVYIDPHDVEELGQAIHEVLIDSRRRERMIQDGFSFAERFSDQSIAQNIMRVYQDAK